MYLRIRNTITVGVVLCFCFLIVSTSFAKNLIDEKTLGLEKVKISMELSDVFTKDKFFEVFTEEDIKLLKSIGREIIIKNDEVLVSIKSTPRRNEDGEIILYENGKPIEVNRDGTIMLSKNRKNELISLDKEGKIVGTNAITRNGSKEVIFKLSGGQILESMQKKEELAKKRTNEQNKVWHGKAYGQKYYIGDIVHCNRFNGPLTDCIHYDKWADPVLALRNFYGSDCEAVVLNFGPCVMMLDSFCNHYNNPGACSFFTSYPWGFQCPKTFHLHSTPAVWRFPYAGA